MRKSGYWWGLLASKKVTDQLLAVGGEHALGMELDTFDRELAVTKTHDDGSTVAIDSTGADLELFRERFLGNNQGMIASGGHWGGDAAENGAAIVIDLAGLSVHEIGGTNNITTESGADGLVSETDA